MVLPWSTLVRTLESRQMCSNILIILGEKETETSSYLSNSEYNDQLSLFTLPCSEDVFKLTISTSRFPSLAYEVNKDIVLYCLLTE